MEKETDVVIVGTGAAGLFGALQLPKSTKINVITKDAAENSDSFLAQGGICMLRSEDDYGSYYEDTMKAGHYRNSPKSVEMMIRSYLDMAWSSSGRMVSWHLPEKGGIPVRGFCSTRISRARKSLGNCWHRQRSAAILPSMSIPR